MVFVPANKKNRKQFGGQNPIFGSKIFDFESSPRWIVMKNYELLAAQSVLLSHGSKVYSIPGISRPNNLPTVWTVKSAETAASAPNSSG